jgi:hypothetical protein
MDRLRVPLVNESHKEVPPRASCWRSAWPTIVALVIALIGTSSVFAESATGIECTIRFQLKKNWAVYERADGPGMVSCADGTAIPVVVVDRGAGLSVGVSKIGTGNFSNVHRISDVIGSYAQTGMQGGTATSSRQAQLMMKGGGSLALAGTGEGSDLGIGLASSAIRRMD